MEDNTIRTQDMLRYEQRGVGERGKAIGHFVPTGLQPGFLDKFELNGVELPDDFFMPDSGDSRNYNRSVF